MKMKMILSMIFSFVALGIVFKSTDGACTMPDQLMNHKWMDSNKGIIEFSTWKLTGWSFTVDGQIIGQWEVVDNVYFEDKGYLALRSIETFDLINQATNASEAYYSYVCLKFTQKRSVAKPVEYVYYQLHDPEPRAGNERVLLANHDGLTRFEEICDENYTYSREEFRMMIKDGQLKDSWELCPNAVLGKYDYTYTETNGTKHCENDDDLWDGCANTYLMSFNYTACDQKMAYSADGQVACVHNLKDDTTDVTYTMVLNLDVDLTADTHRFACFASTPTNDMATVVPGGCMAGQSTNSFPVDKNGNMYGAKITTKSLETCPTNPPGDGDTPSVNVLLAIVLGIGGVILLLIGGVLIYCCCFKRKKRDQDSKDKQIDGQKETERDKERKF